MLCSYDAIGDFVSAKFQDVTWTRLARMNVAVASFFGLNQQQAQSLLLAVAVLAVVIIPQFMFTAKADPEQTAAILSRHKAKQRQLAAKLKELVTKSAAALGHSKRD